MDKKVTFDELIEKIPNKYELTIVVGKRVRELGAHNVINSKAGKKETIIQKCFKEIRDGVVVAGDAELMLAEKIEKEALDKLRGLSEDN